MIVRELELDLDAFEGPFDLLLTLILKEEVELAEIDVAGIVLAFIERLAARDELDLEACGEFLVLVSALLELKARALFDADADLAELEPEEAAEELARRLEEYRRMKEAARWLSERLASERDRFFRLGPAPLAPASATPRVAPQEPAALAASLRALAVEPPAVSLAHMELRFPPVSQFLGRFRTLLRRRSRFDFDAEVAGLSRPEQAIAFLALLELRRANEIALSQAAPFAPIRVTRAHAGVGARGGRVPGNREVSRPSILDPRADRGDARVEAWPEEEGGSRGKHGFLRGSEPQASDVRQETTSEEERSPAWNARSA